MKKTKMLQGSIMMIKGRIMMKTMSGKSGGTWKCTAKCKALKQFEVDTVREFKSHFVSE